MLGFNNREREIIEGYAESVGIKPDQEESDQEEEFPNRIYCEFIDAECTQKCHCDSGGSYIGNVFCQDNCDHNLGFDIDCDNPRDNPWVDCAKKSEALGE